MTERDDYVRRTDPLGDYRDRDGVVHRWDHDRSDWFHADPTRSVCRDRSCPGNVPVIQSELATLRLIGTNVLDAHHADDELVQLTLRVDPVVDRLRLSELLDDAIRDVGWQLRYEREE